MCKECVMKRPGTHTPPPRVATQERKMIEEARKMMVSTKAE